MILPFAAKYSSRPSRRHCGRAPPPADTATRPLISGKRLTYTSVRPDSSDVNAINRPSGERLASVSFAGVCNKRCGGESPDAATVKRSHPVSPEKARNTIVLPSGVNADAYWMFDEVVSRFSAPLPRFARTTMFGGESEAMLYASIDPSADQVG